MYLIMLPVTYIICHNNTICNGSTASIIYLLSVNNLCLLILLINLIRYIYFYYTKIIFKLFRVITVLFLLSYGIYFWIFIVFVVLFINIILCFIKIPIALYLYKLKTMSNYSNYFFTYYSTMIDIIMINKPMFLVVIFVYLYTLNIYFN